MSQQPTEPDWVVQNDLDHARALLDGLEANTKADAGYPLQDDVLDAFLLLEEHDRPTWARIQQILRRAKVTGITKEMKLRRANNRGLHAVGDDDQPNTLTDPPIDLTVPPGYVLSDSGIWVETRDGAHRKIAEGPILITGRMLDDDGNWILTLAWRTHDRGWQARPVDRAEAMDSQKLRALAGVGFPVNSKNAADLTAYLSALEFSNTERLPEIKIARRLGWLDHQGAPAFLWGRTLFLPDGTEASLRFEGREAGDNQIADAYHARGTMDGWKQAISVLRGHPRALTVVYASFASVLLEILNAHNFIVHLGYPTSTGKTTTLRAGGSVWGNPDEHAQATVLSTWNATLVRVERAAAVGGALPLILDDTKQARNAELQETVIYSFSGGQGRGRGNLKGLERTDAWRSVLLSSGESALTSHSQAAGATMRVLELRGFPLTVKNAETGKLAEQINVGVTANYGHAGPAFVRYLLANRQRWDAWARQHATLTEGYKQLAQRSGHDRADRLAPHMGVIDLAARLAHEALDLPWSYEPVDVNGRRLAGPVQRVWSEVAARTDDAAGLHRALRHALSEAERNKESFWGRQITRKNRAGEEEYVTPRTGWWGKWLDGKDWSCIAFLPTVLGEVLKRGGFDSDAIVRGWKGEGWLITDADESRYQKTMRMPTGTAKLVVITREAFETAEAAAET